MLIVVPRFGHVFVSRRRATGGAPVPVPVPGAAIFRDFEQQQEQYEEGKYNMNNLSF